jgi:hypothetical protein
MEFIGEYALVNNKFLFHMYNDFVPKARKLKIRIARKLRK